MKIDADFYYAIKLGISFFVIAQYLGVRGNTVLPQLIEKLR